MISYYPVGFSLNFCLTKSSGCNSFNILQKNTPFLISQNFYGPQEKLVTHSINSFLEYFFMSSIFKQSLLQFLQLEIFVNHILRFTITIFMKHHTLRNKNLNQEHFQALCHSKHLKRLQSIHKQMSYQMKDIQNFQKKTLHRVQQLPNQGNIQEKENVCSLPKLKHCNSLQSQQNQVLSKRKDNKIAELMKSKKNSYISSKVIKKQQNHQFPNIRRSQHKNYFILKNVQEKKENSTTTLTSNFVKVGAGSPTYKIYLEILPQKFSQIQSEVSGSTLKYFLEISDGHSQGKSSIVCLQSIIKNKFIIYLTCLTSPNLLSIRLFNQSLYKNTEKFHMTINITNSSGIQIMQNALMEILSVKGQIKISHQLPIKLLCKKLQKKQQASTQKDEQQLRNTN